MNRNSQLARAPQTGASPLATLLVGLVAATACDEFTCADYATCTVDDDGGLSDSGATNDTTVSSSTADTGNANDSTKTSSPSTQSTQGGEISIVIGDASTLPSHGGQDERDASSLPPLDASKHDARAENQQDAEQPPEPATGDAGEANDREDAGVAPADSSDAGESTFEPDANTSTSPLETTSVNTSSEPVTDTTGTSVNTTSGTLKLANGAACDDANECESNFCADGVCCDTACDGSCETCSDDGECSITEDDNECAPITCQASTACITYPGPNTSARCDDSGSCITQEAYCQPTFADVGDSCGSGLACNAEGACVSVCEEGELWCDGECVDPDSNDENCGTCDNSCEDGAFCQNADCACPTEGEEYCEGQCVAVSSDNENCGGCGVACSGDEACFGACRSWQGHSQLWDASSGQQGPHVLATANGDFVVTYTQIDTNGIWDIWSVRYSGATQTWSGAERVESVDRFANGGVAGIDGQGTTFAVWFQDEPNDGASRIRTANRGESGGWSTSTALSESGQIAIFPKLAVLSNGDAIAAWDQRSTPSDPTSIFYARRSGGSWQATVPLESQTGISSLRHLTTSANGTALALWINNAADSTTSTLYASMWDGSSWGAPANLVSDSTTKMYATAASDASGNYYVGWFELDPQRTKVRRYNSGTGTWGSPKVFTNTYGGFISIAATPSGIPHVTWTNESSEFVWVSIDPGTGDWLTPTTIGTGFGDVTGGTRVDSASNIMLLWRDDNMLKWRQLANGSGTFSPERPIMELNGQVFGHTWALSPTGQAMAIYSFGPGDGTSNLGFNSFE